MSLAYLDPGSGSLIASALVGGAAAAGVAVKSARAKFTGAFSRKRTAGAETDETAKTDETTEPAEPVETAGAAEPVEPVDAKAEVAEPAKSES